MIDRANNRKVDKMKWVYIRTESCLFTVGFYTPEGEWMPESDYNTPQEAADRCHYLNGGD